MTLSQHDVDDIARKVSDLKSEASEVAVILQVGLGREHDLAVSAAAATEKLLQQLRRFSVSKSEQPQYRSREQSA